MLSGMLRYYVNPSVAHHMGSHLVRSRPQRRNVQVKEALHLRTFEEDLQRAIQESLKDLNRNKRSSLQELGNGANIAGNNNPKSVSSRLATPSNITSASKITLKSRLKVNVACKREGAQERNVAEKKKSSLNGDELPAAKRTLRSSRSALEEEELQTPKPRGKRENNTKQAESKRSRIAGRRTLRSGKPLSIECQEVADDQDSGCGSSNQSPGSDVSPTSSQHVDLSDGEISMKLSREDAHTVSRVKARRRLYKRSLHADSGIQVPSFRMNIVSSSYSMEGTEDITDEAFEKMHHKLEVDEKRRKRWDRQLQKEQELQERAREKERQRLERNSPVKSMYPAENTVRQIELSEDTPITLFRFPLVKVDSTEFRLPWEVEPRPAPKRSRTTGAARGERTAGRKLRSSRRQR